MGKKHKHSTAAASPLFYFLFIFLLIILPFFYFNGIPDRVLMPRLLLANLSLIAFFTVVLVKPFMNMDLAVLKNPVILSITALAIITLLSLIWAVNPSEGLFDTVKSFTFLMMIVVMISLFNSIKNWKIRITQLVLITSLATSIIGWYQYFNFVLPYPDRKIEEFPSVLYLVKGIMAHKNQFSIALLMYLPFVIYGTIKLKGLWKLLSVTALIMNLCLILILETRSVWVGLAAASGFVLLSAVLYHKPLGISKKRLNAIVAILVTGILSTGILFFVAINTQGYLNKKFQTLTNPEHNRNIHRIKAWSLTLDMALENPVTGVGAGNWKIEAPKYHQAVKVSKSDFNWLRPHNDFLWVLSEKGIFGLLAYAAAFILAFMQVFKILKNHENKALKLFILLIAGGLTGFIMVSMFSFPMERMHHQVYLAMYFAIIVSTTSRNNHPEHRPGNLKRIVITALILGVLGTAYSLEMIRVEKHIFKADLALQQSHWDDVIREANAAKSMFRNTDHDNIPFSWYPGMAYFSKGDLTKSAKFYKKALAQNPYNPVVLNNYAQVLIGLSAYKKAGRILKKLVERYDYYPEAIVNLSTCYYHLGRYHMALVTLKKLKWKDKSPQIRSNIKALRKLKKTAETANSGSES